MGYSLNFGQGVVVLPATVLSAEATSLQMRVLLWLSSDLSLAEKPIQLAKLAGCKKEEATDALAFWKREGVLSSGSEPVTSEKTEKSVPVVKILQREDAIPTYRTEELAAMMEGRKALKSLLDESQQLLGKMFNTHDVNLLFGMVDYLGLSEEYILVLLSHCQRVGIRTMRGVEKYAIDLVNREIRTEKQLEVYLQNEEEKQRLEGKIRTMFGMKSRELTQKEKKMIGQWVAFGYGEEIIRMAYEITVDATGEASMNYANAIMERWHAEGLNEKKQIEEKLEQEKEERNVKIAAETKRPRGRCAKKEKTVPVGEVGNSFDEDDFFEAALHRSFEKPDQK